MSRRRARLIAAGWAVAIVAWVCASVCFETIVKIVKGEEGLP